MKIPDSIKKGNDLIIFVDVSYSFVGHQAINQSNLLTAIWTGYVPYYSRKTIHCKNNTEKR